MIPPEKIGLCKACAIETRGNSIYEVVDFLNLPQLFEEGVSFVSFVEGDSVFSFEAVSVEGVELFSDPDPEPEPDSEPDSEGELSPFRG
jgi:hypothetical protein